MKSRFLLLLALTTSAIANEPPAADRQAILAMAGEFEVTFHFQESFALKEGYEIKPDKYTEKAHELVLVAEDTGRQIRLQHLLVAEGMVIKHWAQIWTFEDTRICEFQGHNRWKMRDLTAAEAAGTWSEQVTQVDDSPRYESWGKWVHHEALSQWTSKDTWRPLPRREHKKRKDYDVMGGTNRYALTAAGWAHEQDNTKLIVRDGIQRPLVREFGLNTYIKVKNFDFSPARALWEKDQAFWDTVVQVWDDVQVQRPEFAIRDTFDVPALRKSLTAIQQSQQKELADKVRANLESFLNAQATPPPAPETSAITKP
jgi:hypothetical protein